MLSKEEAIDQLMAALDVLEPADLSLAAKGKLLSYLYTTPPHLSSAVGDLDVSLQIKNPSRAQLAERGRAMEVIALVLFTGLLHWTGVRSFQSAAAQYDLLISGAGHRWTALMKTLFGLRGRDTLLIEAKATKERLADEQLARMCGIIESHLTTVAVGIFLTIKGASGSQQRQRALRDCRLRQVVYFARTGTPIVILDISHLRRLAAGENLVKVLTAEIRELSEVAGLRSTAAAEPEEVELPDHLQRALGRD